MNSFRADIVLKDDRYRFFFDKIQTPSGFKFYVACRSKNNRQSLFTMENRENEWQIVNAPKIADDILELQPQLASIVKKYL